MPKRWVWWTITQWLSVTYSCIPMFERRWNSTLESNRPLLIPWSVKSHNEKIFVPVIYIVQALTAYPVCASDGSTDLLWDHIETLESSVHTSNTEQCKQSTTVGEIIATVSAALVEIDLPRLPCIWWCFDPNFTGKPSLSLNILLFGLGWGNEKFFRGAWQWLQGVA